MSQRRPGYTLIEMLVAMTLVSVALTAVALTLHALYRADRRLRDGMAAELSLDRLTAALRQDAHSASSAKLTTDDSGRATALVLSLPAEQSITYTIRPRGIERLAVREGKESRDTYHVGSSSAGWQLNAEKTPVRITLRLPPADETPRTSNLRHEIGVVAGVGLIRPPTFAAPPSGENEETVQPSTEDVP